jgi:hypothetical protein
LGRISTGTKNSRKATLRISRHIVLSLQVWLFFLSGPSLSCGSLDRGRVAAEAPTSACGRCETCPAVKEAVGVPDDRVKLGTITAEVMNFAASLGLTPTQWLGKYLVRHKYADPDRAEHEMRALAQFFKHAVIYNQINVASPASFEILAWRWRLLLTAHEAKPLSPDYGGSEYFDPLGASEGGVAPQLQRAVAKQMKGDAGVQTRRSKARELRSAGWAPPYDAK